MLTIVSRYTNTLFVSLNNRIYFRDHPSSGVHIMGDCVVESEQSHIRFPPVGSAAHTTTLDDSSISHTIDVEKGSSDAVGVSLGPRCRHNATAASMCS
jgi:hypothetical protein